MPHPFASTAQEVVLVFIRSTGEDREFYTLTMKAIANKARAEWKHGPDFSPFDYLTILIPFLSLVFGIRYHDEEIRKVFVR
jgi:hypothetical protein